MVSSNPSLPSPNVGSPIPNSQTYLPVNSVVQLPPFLIGMKPPAQVLLVASSRGWCTRPPMLASSRISLSPLLCSDWQFYPECPTFTPKQASSEPSPLPLFHCFSPDIKMSFKKVLILVLLVFIIQKFRFLYVSICSFPIKFLKNIFLHN